MVGLVISAMATMVLTSAPPPAEPHMDAARIARLVQRIDQSYQLLQERKYDEAYGMLGSAWRQGRAERKDAVRYHRKSEKSIRILGWTVKRILIAGNRAKVRIVIRGETREAFFRWEEGVREEDVFWVFENGDWYSIPLKLSDWDDSHAVEVPVPEQPMKVNINEKD